MNDSIFDYWSRSEAAEKFGMSVASLKKQEEVAAELGFGLSENFVRKSNTKFWHKDEWFNIRAAKLQKYIDEAVGLGLVVTVKDNQTAARNEFDKGYNAGFAAGVASVADELPPSNPYELNELEDVETTAYTAGGFQPLSSLGL